LGNDPDRAHEILERCVLVDHAGDAGIERVAEQRIVAVARVEDHARRDVRPAQTPQHLEPADARHACVQHRNVRTRLLDLAQRIFTVACAGGDRDLVVAEESRKELEYGGMVVRDHARDAHISSVLRIARVSSSVVKGFWSSSPATCCEPAPGWEYPDMNN